MIPQDAGCAFGGTRSRIDKHFIGMRRYFGCKPPAIFLRGSSCQSAATCLASNLKADLPGW